MNWVSTVWLAIAAACLTLTAIHAHAWWQRREAVANAAFAVLAASVAGLGYAELRMMLATSPDEYGRMLWWYHLPVWAAFVALIGFVRLYLRAGRAWLGTLAIVLRTLSLVINFVSSPGINFREITSLETVTLLGQDVSIAHGAVNPLLVIANLSLVILIVFVADATREVWRRGERRRAMSVGGSLVLFVSAGTVMGIMSFWGIASVPLFSALLFLPSVIAMAFELSLDVNRAARLAAELDAKGVALQESEQKLALAADAANAGLWSVEPGSGRLWATPRAMAMFGLSPQGEHRVEDILRSVHPEDREQVREFVATPRRSSESAAIEYRIVRPDGQVRWHALRGRAHVEGGGASRGQMGVTVDITERRAAEDEAARRRAELEHLERVATVSKLSEALAHEINQPLAIIMSNAEAAQRLLVAPQPDLGEIRAILDDIVSADGRAGEVITRLRGMLKRGQPSPQRLSMNRLVADVLKFMRADLVRRGVSVETSFAAGLPEVRADRVPIEQVLINVIGNACDAMAGNPDGERSLRVETAASAGEVEVRIVDKGAGLPEPPERVFAPFYTTKPEGLGLGLSIARHIVAGHGGRLWAEANACRGATFRLSLPSRAAP